MRQLPVVDALDLWRGIDDAIWREATRTPVAAATVPRLVMSPPRKLAAVARVNALEPA